MLSKARLEAFSDGVFAIAITLLVFTIAQPGNYRDLARDLAGRWPSFAAYVVSFAVIGIMWLNHHSVFAHFRRIDRGLVYCNLLLLMTVAFLPYPTGVLGQALARGSGQRAAAVLYGITMVVNAVAWSGLWLYAAHRRRLLEESFPESQRRASTLAFTLGGVVYAIAVGVAFWNGYAFLLMQAALAVYYALDPLSRQAARGPEVPGETGQVAGRLVAGGEGGVAPSPGEGGPDQGGRGEGGRGEGGRG